MKFLDAIIRKYPTLDEYWIIARRTERLETLAKKINVLLLCPGNMDTEMNPRGKGRQSQKINELPFLNMKR